MNELFNRRGSSKFRLPRSRDFLLNLRKSLEFVFYTYVYKPFQQDQWPFSCFVYVVRKKLLTGTWLQKLQDKFCSVTVTFQPHLITILRLLYILSKFQWYKYQQLLSLTTDPDFKSFTKVEFLPWIKFTDILSSKIASKADVIHQFIHRIFGDRLQYCCYNSI